MKYKLLLIVICITRIRTAIGDDPDKSNVGKPGQEIKLIDYGLDKSAASLNKAAIKAKIRTDKNGNKWIFDENSGEWMHLPPQAHPMQSNGFNINGLNFDGPNRDEELEDESNVYQPVFQLKAPQKPIVSQNSPSIYGPQYPSGYNPNGNNLPSRLFNLLKSNLLDYVNQINHGSGIYGPMPAPNGMDPMDQEDDNNPNDIPWQPNNIQSNQFPIPGGPGPNYPGPVDSGRPIAQPTPPKNGRNKPTVPLETFEDPFDGEPHKRPKKVRKITRMSTTTGQYDEDLPVITGGPNFEPIFDNDIAIHPIKDIFIDYPENRPFNKPQQKPSPFKKPIRKPIIIKVPVVPQDQYNYWTNIVRSPTQKPTPVPANPQPQEDDNNNEGDTVELYPPVPPEYPTFVYPNPKAGTKSTVMPSAVQSVQKETEWTPIALTGLATTTTTTPSTTTTVPTTITTTTTTTTTTPVPTQESTVSSTKEQKNSQNNNIENNSQKKDIETIDGWRPVTLLGKRRQTPVPLINFPTLPPVLEDIQRRPAESWAIRPHNPPGSLGSIGNSGGLMPEAEDSNAWVRPSMLVFATKRDVTTTRATTTTAPITKRKSVTKRKAKITTTTEPTTTELPTTLTTQKKIKKVKSATTLTPKTTTVTTTTTTTSEPKTTIKRKIKVKVPKRKLKFVVQSTTQSVIPEETEEIDYTDNSESTENQVPEESTEETGTETDENTSGQEEQTNPEESEDHKESTDQTSEENTEEQTSEENTEEQTSEEESLTETSPEESTETEEEVEEVIEEVEENQTDDSPKESGEQPAEEQTDNGEEEEIESEEEETEEVEEIEEETKETEKEQQQEEPKPEVEKEQATKAKQKAGEWQQVVPFRNKEPISSAKPKKKSN